MESIEDTCLIDQILYELDTNEQSDKELEELNKESEKREKRLNDYFKGDL